MLNELYQVQPIVDDVRNRGDAAVKELVLVYIYALLCLFHQQMLSRIFFLKKKMLSRICYVKIPLFSPSLSIRMQNMSLPLMILRGKNAEHEFTFNDFKGKKCRTCVIDP